MNAIVEFFVNIYEWIKSIFSQCLSWFLDLIYNSLSVLVAPIAEALPDLSSAWDSFQVVAPFTAFVNQWIALDFAFQLLIAYFTFILIMISVKLIIKLFVPTVG